MKLYSEVCKVLEAYYLDKYKILYRKICLYIVIVIVIFIWWSPFISSRNLDEVFTYNHIGL